MVESSVSEVNIGVLYTVGPSLLKKTVTRGRDTSLYKLYKFRYYTPSGRVFESFWSENGYTLCPFWSGIGYGFRGNYGLDLNNFFVSALIYVIIT